MTLQISAPLQKVRKVSVVLVALIALVVGCATGSMWRNFAEPAQAQSTSMTVYEYQVLDLQSSQGGQADRLNSLGRQGWRLVTTSGSLAYLERASIVGGAPGLSGSSYPTNSQATPGATPLAPTPGAILTPIKAAPAAAPDASVEPEATAEAESPETPTATKAPAKAPAASKSTRSAKSRSRSKAQAKTPAKNSDTEPDPLEGAPSPFDL